MDDFNRERPAIEVAFSLPSARVVRALEQIIQWRGKPAMIRVDNGFEYLSETLVNWASKHQLTLSYIQPGKPQQNDYVERYNRTVRNEWLGTHIFHTIEEEQNHATQWLWTYSNPSRALAAQVCIVSDAGKPSISGRSKVTSWTRGLAMQELTSRSEPVRRMLLYWRSTLQEWPPGTWRKCQITECWYG